MIKVINNRVDGDLFHYAHFICDCLFPEIVNDVYKYKQVFRIKHAKQTIGNFGKIYTDVMSNSNTEVEKKTFDNLKFNTIVYKNKEQYSNITYFNKFRNFIFSRYNINPLVYNENYPRVILIKRYGRVNLLNDPQIMKQTKNYSTGKERREITQIDVIEKHLENKYGNLFKSVYLELTPFEEQVKYFNNAKLIIAAHGAGLSNLFFCKQRTKVIEVTCGKKWEFFDTISRVLNLQHIKCNKNKFDEIYNCIQMNTLKNK
jgi:hypothetical protein